MEEAFEAKYPGIDLIGFDISSTEQIERLRAEAQSGNTAADVAYISDAPVVFSELVSEGILMRYVPPEVADQVPDQYEQPLLANRLSTKVLMYNEEAHPDGAPIDNLWELTEDAWKGRVVMVDPLVRGDYLDLMTEVVLRSDEMAQAYEDHFGSPVVLEDGINNAGEQWIVDLLDNGAVLVDDTDEVNAAVGAQRRSGSALAEAMEGSVNGPPLQRRPEAFDRTMDRYPSARVSGPRRSRTSLRMPITRRPSTS